MLGYRFIVVGLLAVAFFLCSIPPLAEAQEVLPVIEFTDDSLPRIEPLEIEAAKESFQVAAGYRVELVAAEPLVMDPVAFCFDPQGRLIVVEMRGYSERPDDAMGRVRRLTDDNGDGLMDRVETLLEGLSWPTAVECYSGGILIAAAPDLLFLPAGHRLGDEPVLLASGFGKSNVQGLVNSLRWGVDLRLHGATSSSGGELSFPRQSTAMRLGNRDFALTPGRNQLDIVEGGGQHGMVIDPWGDKYVCSNSDHLQQVLLTPARNERSQRISSAPPMRRSIASDGPQADVFRASPVEPWRVLRTRLRVSGAVPGIVEGGGRAAGYFTGATGIYVMDGDQWPSTGDPTALVCDVGSNLIHRKRLHDDGLWKRGERVDEKAEFLRSSDIWFRPVQLGSGPDGALYVCDMYREVIEHPLSLPPQIKKQLDLNSGNERGRIWRVLATDRPIRRGRFDLEQATSVQLAAYLDHGNAWHRKTAARLLVERQDVGVIPSLRRLVGKGLLAEGRLQALYCLAQLPGGLDRNSLSFALQDPHARIRQRALELAASYPESLPDLTADQLMVLAKDDSIEVRFQLAFDAKSVIGDAKLRSQILATIAGSAPGDPWIQWAIEGSLGNETSLFASAFNDTLEQMPGDLQGLWQQIIVAQCIQYPSEMSQQRLLAILEGNPHANVLETLADAVRITPANTQPFIANWILQQDAPHILKVSAQGDDASPLARAKLRLMRWASPSRANELLKDALRPSQAAVFQQQALQFLVGNDPESTRIVLQQLESLTPEVQSLALTVLGSQREGQRQLARSVRAGELEATILPIELQRQLREHPDDDFKIPAVGSAADITLSDAEIARYEQHLSGTADTLAGAAVFKRVCTTCHRWGGIGQQVGPDLKSLADKSPEQILLAILDPNREIDPRFRVVHVETIDGRIIAGIVSNESADGLQVTDSQGKPHTIPRLEIEVLRTQNRSLMPVGLEKEISPEQMRDLIGYLKSTPSGEDPAL
jgi:putative membrane-bound dehydrogenase-like protein